MADTSYLERMGRELKCPICLSLLDSAMSLTCNHVFCNSCIHKSMRSGSNCPVCKVPYQRREIRPAPHMDNLVNIYKSMEVASGLSLFVTQNPPTIDLSDAEKQTEGDGDYGAGGETPETVKLKGNRTKTLSRIEQKNSGSNRGKPSFSTNKRVQVPHSPIAETPVRQAMSQPGKGKIMDNVSDKNLDSPSEHPPSNEKGSQLFSPFFWLREDVDKSSQQTDVDHLTGTPAKAPSFSDIKDSDDDVPSKRSPEEELLRKCNNADLFDSEMFEWTQRACSPELCSTPIKMQVQVEDRSKFGGMEIEEEAPSNSAVTNREMITEYMDNVSFLEKNCLRDSKLHNNSSPGSKMPNKRGRKASKINKKKNSGQVREDQDGSETHDGTIQSKASNPQLAIGSPKADCIPKTRYGGSTNTKSLKEVDDPVASELLASFGSKSKRGRSEENKLKRSFKSFKQSHGVGSVKRKKQKCNLTKSDMIEEVNMSQDGRHENAMSKSNLSSGRSSGKAFTSCTTRKNKRCGHKMICGIKNQVNEDNVCQENMVDGSKDAQVTQVHNVQKEMPSLHKCDATSIKCAFCHSSGETEASGEMVHYSQGRPVSEKHGAGPVIHSHKNCTEWAPNVYFEDDSAVNLEEELARSRRMRCSLCGVKGAALGCYEKSCRKSFHVPCAKMLRECRWDTDHFVILCPLHASSKLPCELSTSHVKNEKTNLKRKYLRQQSQVAVGHGSTNTNPWNHGRSSEKLVLCCSGLAVVEKETVCEFAKSSGVVISTSWNPSVTHVIASVDEHGACRRTLKVLMGILEGKWIVGTRWVQACMKAMRLVEETPYEINCDIHGVKNGPRLGKLRLLNKQPKLFAGFKFYFIGDFVPSYKGYLQDLVTAAGGSVLHRKPIAEANSYQVHAIPPQTIIVYSIELPDKCDLSKKDMILERRRSDAESLASSSSSRVANNSWVLKCIAGHKLQDL